MLRFDNMCVDEPEEKIEMMVKRIELLLEKFRVYYNAVSPNYYVNRDLLELKKAVRRNWTEYKYDADITRLNYLFRTITKMRDGAEKCGDKMRALALDGVLDQYKEALFNINEVKPCKN